MRSSTGKSAFGELTGARLVAAIIEDTPPAPRSINPKISPGLERVILRALQKDPKERYQSAGDLRIDLANLATGTAPTFPRPVQSSKWARWLLLGMAVALIGVGIWWQRHRGDAGTFEETMMAVLPFESVANDPPTNALGLGLTETVTAKLVQAVEGGHLQLVSTRELMAQGVKTPDQARKEFGTDLVLEGSMQQDGARIRITWSLVNSRTHTQIAANTITGNADDIFGLQDNIFDEVLEKLPYAVPRNGDWRCRAGRIRRRRPTTSIYGVVGIWKTTKVRTPLRMQSSNSKKRSTSTTNTRRHMRRWGLPTTPASYTKIREKTGWKRRVTSANGHSPSDRNWRKGILAWATFWFRLDVTKAVQQFQRSLDLDHNSDETLRSLANAYQKLGKPAAAEEAYRKAVSLRPNYWGVYSAFGNFYNLQARYSDAAGMFKKAIQLAPSYYYGYSNLGAMYLQLGLYEGAVGVLKHSIALRPSLEAYGNLGAVYFYMKRYADSAESLHQALKIDSKDWLNWGNLGDALSRIPERREEAKKAYQKALELAEPRLQVNPRDALTLAFTADYYAMIDEEGLAKERIGKALENAPNDAEVLFRAAILYNHFRETDKTIDSLGKAVAAGYSRTAIRDTPDFDPLKDNPRFRALISSK